MRWLLLCCCCVLTVLPGRNAMGEPSVSPNEEVQLNFRHLMETNSCPNCNLAGAVLNRIDLSEANLEGANLAGAQLYLASLAGANLRNANLQGAALGGADLAGADLRGANLTGAVIEGAYLVGAMLDGTVVTRRPYIEKGGPDAGETVYVDDEASSKNLPFTDKAYVSGPQDKDKAETADESAARGQTVSGEEEPVQEEAGQALKMESSRQDDAATVQEPLSGKSKQLVMMADAVVPQESHDTEEMAVAVDSPQDKAESAELLTEVVPREAVDAPAPQIPPPDSEEAEMAAAGTDAEILRTEEDLPAQGEQPAGGADAGQGEQAAAVVQQAEGEHLEDSAGAMEEQQSDKPIEQLTVMDKDTVVAEVAAPGETAGIQKTTAGEQPVPAGIPVRQEMDAADEQTQMGPQKADVQEPVQEEVMPSEPVQMNETADAGREEQEKVMPEQAMDAATAQDETGSVADEEKKRLVEKLLDDNSCVECDLSGVDLSGRDLDEADLERANLQGANLRKADLSETNLKGANLQGANLQDADLRGADLYRADLSGADLTGARFKGALIDMVISAGAIGADFEGAEK